MSTTDWLTLLLKSAHFPLHKRHLILKIVKNLRRGTQNPSTGSTMLSLFILPSASLPQVIHILQWALQDSQHVVHTLCTCPTAPVNPWEGTQEGVLRKKEDLTTSGSSLIERSWMALITIHMDDRRNITPKMTQALQRNKTLRHLTGRTPPAHLHNDSDNDTTRGTGTQPWLATFPL